MSKGTLQGFADDMDRLKISEINLSREIIHEMLAYEQWLESELRRHTTGVERAVDAAWERHEP